MTLSADEGSEKNFNDRDNEMAIHNDSIHADETSKIDVDPSLAHIARS